MWATMPTSNLKWWSMSSDAWALATNLWTSWWDCPYRTFIKKRKWHWGFFQQRSSCERMINYLDLVFEGINRTECTNFPIRFPTL
jgi:hypothetical protein